MEMAVALMESGFTALSTLGRIAGGLAREGRLGAPEVPALLHAAAQDALYGDWERLAGKMAEVRRLGEEAMTSELGREALAQIDAVLRDLQDGRTTDAVAGLQRLAREVEANV